MDKKNRYIYIYMKPMNMPFFSSEKKSKTRINWDQISLILFEEIVIID